MFGDNPKRGLFKGDGNILQVENIFYTLQGEGPYALMPSVFIRLGGCNLACEFCDTEFENFKEQDLTNIISEVRKLSTNPASGKRIAPLVVITGGEPLRQPIERLCSVLLDDGFKVQIETNGTLYRELPEQVDIICSPKVVGGSMDGKYAKIRADLAKRLRGFKFLVSKSLCAYNSIPSLGQDEFDIEVYVQPMDQYDTLRNKENLELALEIVHNYGYRLSMQLHKIIGIE